MDRNVKMIVGMGSKLTDMFTEKGGILTDAERYSILKLAELCIAMSKRPGQIRLEEKKKT